MNKLKISIAISKMLTIITLIIVVITGGFNNKMHSTASAMNQSSMIVMERDSGRVLYENDAYSKRYMASTTKILTAITILENCNPYNIVTITDKTTGIEGSSIYLEPGEKLSVIDLLYGLMLRSGNDCAETLAVYCSGTINNFALLMNRTAKKAGAYNSNFVNPHGLHDDNHYTTAYDLARISCYAMKNDMFRQIVGTTEKNIPFTTRNTIRHLINKNKMLKEYNGATGIKTGYTKKAGRCLVSSAIKDGMEVITVVLNCPPMFEKSKELLDYAFNNYKNYKLVESDNILGFVKLRNAENKIPVHIKNDIVLPLTDKEKENIKIIYDIPKILEIPNKIDKPIGNVKIYSENSLLFEEKIYIII